MDSRTREKLWDLADRAYGNSDPDLVIVGRLEALVEINHETKEADIGFRGSAGGKDWLSNARAFPAKRLKPLIELARDKHHKLGHVITWGSLRPYCGDNNKLKGHRKIVNETIRFIKLIYDRRLIPPYYTINVTGHSKGGGHAAYFVKLLWGLEASMIHASNLKDGVTHLPPRIWFTRGWHFADDIVEFKELETEGTDHTMEDYRAWI